MLSLVLGGLPAPLPIRLKLGAYNRRTLKPTHLIGARVIERHDPEASLESRLQRSFDEIRSAGLEGDNDGKG